MVQDNPASSLNRAPSRAVTIGRLAIGGGAPLALVAGPCQLESLDHAAMLAERLRDMCALHGIGFIFKGSFDKANRSSVKAMRGVGLEKGLEILSCIGTHLGVPTLTDVHDAEQCAIAARSVDVLQIPAFLCRQTDLLLAAGESGTCVNIKKGPFLAPWDMRHAAEKVFSTGNRNVILCERGTSFGYNCLVNDFRALPVMAETGCPVMFDATHSVQRPGGLGAASGGERLFAPPLARAAVAVGVDALFIETHQDPDNAPSDGPNMIPIAQMPALIGNLARLDRVARECR